MRVRCVFGTSEYEDTYFLCTLIRSDFYHPSMRSLFTLLLTVLSGLYLAQAQVVRPTLKTLRASLDTIPTASAKAAVWRRMATEYLTEVKKDSALAYAHRAEQISRTELDQTGTALALVAEGDVLFHHQQYNESINKYTFARKVATNANDVKTKHFAMMRTARSCEYTFDTIQSFSIYKDIIGYYLGKGDSLNTEIPYRPMALLFLNKYHDVSFRRGALHALQPDEEQLLLISINYLRKNIKILENAPGDYSLELVNAYNIIGTICTYLGYTPDDLGYQLKAMQLSRRAGKESNGDIIRGIADAYEQKGDPEKALVYYNKCLNIETQEKNTRGLALTHKAMAEMYLRLKEKEEALKSAEQALNLTRQLNDPLLLHGMYQLMVEVYTRMGNKELVADFQRLLQEEAARTSGRAGTGN